jgi:hypothetical protein
VLVVETVAFVEEVAGGIDVGVEDEDVAEEVREAVLRGEGESGQEAESQATGHGGYCIRGGVGVEFFPRNS